jgi:formate-nitrite transporter family protein
MDELKEPSARERAKQDHADERAVDEAATLSPKLIYEVVRREGEAELRRPTQSLIWSGIAAGLLISFSLLGEAILRTHLPDTPSRYLIENMGYTLGFLLVILGRMQLFTENTITTVLPVMVEPSAAMFGRLARLWGIVLAANVVSSRSPPPSLRSCCPRSPRCRSTRRGCLPGSGLRAPSRQAS